MKLSEKLKRRIVIAVTSEQYGQELIDAIEAESFGPTVVAGTSAMADSANIFAVVFPAALPTSTYSLAITISNTVDPTVRHLDPTVTAKTASGFTFHTSQTTDHPNYQVNWIVAY